MFLRAAIPDIYTQGGTSDSYRLYNIYRDASAGLWRYTYNYKNYISAALGPRIKAVRADGNTFYLENTGKVFPRLSDGTMFPVYYGGGGWLSANPSGVYVISAGGPLTGQYEYQDSAGAWTGDVFWTGSGYTGAFTPRGAHCGDSGYNLTLSWAPVEGWVKDAQGQQDISYGEYIPVEGSSATGKKYVGAPRFTAPYGDWTRSSQKDSGGHYTYYSTSTYYFSDITYVNGKWRISNPQNRAYYYESSDEPSRSAPVTFTGNASWMGNLTVTFASWAADIDKAKVRFFDVSTIMGW